MFVGDGRLIRDGNLWCVGIVVVFLVLTVFLVFRGGEGFCDAGFSLLWWCDWVLMVV